MDNLETFHLSVEKSLLMLRFFVGKYQVCPVCFCDAMIDVLEQIRDDSNHNETLDPLGEREVDQLNAEINAKYGIDGLPPTQGNA